jgi:predicted  nucleic acid-binding Zn-ribbon protein
MSRSRCACALLLVLASACATHDAPPREKIARPLEEMRQAATREIGDPQRRPPVLQAIDGLESELAQFQAAHENLLASLKQLNGRPEATRAEFSELLARFDRERKAIRTRVLQLHLALTGSTTADEWKALARYERRAIGAAGG